MLDKYVWWLYPPDKMESALHPTVEAWKRSFDVALEYCRPYWEQAARLYEFFRNKQFDALKGTYSRINIAYAYAAVMDRAPKIRHNVFSGPRYVSLRADTPESDFSRDQAEAWLREHLTDRVNIQQASDPLIQTALIMGTAYRMTGVTYVPGAKKDQWEPAIYGRNVDFFHILPCPGGGDVNPLDNQSANALPWFHHIDWWTESKIKYLAEKEILNPAAVKRMLAEKPTNASEAQEEAYRNKYATVGNLQYAGPESWRADMAGIDDKSKRRRIVTWYRRDKTIIIGEDAFLLYKGPTVLPGCVFPLSVYRTCPDISNWFGIPYLGTMEDVLKATIVNTNLRMDHLAGTMFPPTWIRQDIVDFNKLDPSAFRPQPYAIHRFPSSLQGRIQDAVWHDRRAEVPQQAFMEESTFKAIQQKVGGQTETTASMNDVVGNKTATGVTSIMNELSARPNMESMVFEQGLRDECMLYLALAGGVYTRPQFVRGGMGRDGSHWMTVMPHDIAAKFTVETHGTRFMAESNVAYQKLLAFYPYWNSSPNFDKRELDRQSLQVAGIMPDPQKLIVNSDEAPMAGMEDMMESAGIATPGGMASAMDIGQSIRSTRDRTTPEPRTGRAVSANVAY